MELSRKAKPTELKLLDLLISKSSKKVLPINWRESLWVQPLNDGDMGSLRLLVNEKTLNRKFGEQVSEYEFKDDDGIPVLVSLYLDEEGYLYELDIWKIDFSPLICTQKWQEPNL